MWMRPEGSGTLNLPCRPSGVAKAASATSAESVANSQGVSGPGARPKSASACRAQARKAANSDLPCLAWSQEMSPVRRCTATKPRSATAAPPPPKAKRPTASAAASAGPGSKRASKSSATRKGGEPRGKPKAAACTQDGEAGTETYASRCEGRLGAQGRRLEEHTQHAVVHSEHQRLVRIARQLAQIRLKLPPLIVVVVLSQQRRCRQPAADAPIHEPWHQKHLQRKRALGVDQEHTPGQDGQEKGSDDAVEPVALAPALRVGLAAVDQHRDVRVGVAGQGGDPAMMKVDVLGQPRRKRLVGKRGSGPSIGLLVLARHPGEHGFLRKAEQPSRLLDKL
mmetsp:Transcript_89792/g.290080  ORF Transcript_89792/g.290080 Transcript_89792/m.290080 type:complete len:338 (-) Transcript_89792:1394-2407(-)